MKAKLKCKCGRTVPDALARSHVARLQGAAGKGAAKRRSAEHYQRANKVRWDAWRERQRAAGEADRARIEQQDNQERNS